MFKIFLIITILTLSCFGKEIKTIDFSGDIDLVLGDFSKSNLEKVCDISYPTIYKFWKEKPTFTQNDIKICSDLLKDYFDSFGFYRALISYEIVEDKTIFNIKKDEQIKISSIKIEDEYKNIIPIDVVNMCLIWSQSDFITTIPISEFLYKTLDNSENDAK